MKEEKENLVLKFLGFFIVSLFHPAIAGYYPRHLS
jgi:hypothetical protein